MLFKTTFNTVKYIFISFFLINFSLINFCFGNDLEISNLTFLDSTHIRFDVVWQNAWQSNDGKHDAVWCFVKYKKNNSNWQHLLLDSESGNHSLSNTDLEIEGQEDKTGIMLVSQINGMAQAQITLKLAQKIENGSFELQVFGIEMVHIPEAAFFIGDSVASQNAFRQGVFTQDTLAVLPFEIQSENEIELGIKQDELYGSLDDDWSAKANIPGQYPKGFAAFYSMKYEITQGQYVDFLNSLSTQQQKQRTAINPNSEKGRLALIPNSQNPSQSFRNGIVIQSPATSQNSAEYVCNGNQNTVFDELDDGQNWACNYLNAEDILAYLDWAALRPMTEFEFEKACRGTEKPIQGGFSWGTAFIEDANTVIDSGTSEEKVVENSQNKIGLANYNSGIDRPQLQGVLRVGFGSSQETNRLQMGASFYGVLELSGNVWEQCVTVNSAALLFTGNHGNGELNDTGNADAWNFTEAENLLRLRGGAWNSVTYDVGTFRDLSVSARYFANLKTTIRRNTSGGRGVR